MHHTHKYMIIIDYYVVNMQSVLSKMYMKYK